MKWLEFSREVYRIGMKASVTDAYRQKLADSLGASLGAAPAQRNNLMTTSPRASSGDSSVDNTPVISSTSRITMP